MDASKDCKARTDDFEREKSRLGRVTSEKGVCGGAGDVFRILSRK